MCDYRSAYNTLLGIFKLSKISEGVFIKHFNPFSVVSMNVFCKSSQRDKHTLKHVHRLVVKIEFLSNKSSEKYVDDFIFLMVLMLNDFS